MRILSAGSAGGSPGRAVEAMSTEGDRSARLTPGKPHNLLNQISGLMVNRILFFADSVAISHAVMGETISCSLRSNA